MCGISGFNFPDRKLLQQMNRCTAHRGPDNTGAYTDTLVSLGHNRLAIIDLDHRSDQPFFYTHKGRTVGIVFNGEIYNYQEIKEELEGRGYRFTTTSDTEVILASYLEYGYGCVNRFNGMWAFALYDKKEKLLFCSRDRFGKKPFYYYSKAGKFIFSSELKGILQHKELGINRRNGIDTEAVGLYFGLGFIPAPYTIYKDVRKLEARQSMVYDLRKKRITRKWTYYELPKYRPEHDRKALIAEGRELIKDSVRLRMIADVPVGAFLSGGLDSSTIVGEMKGFAQLSEVHTFSIGFEGKYDETPHINTVKEQFGTKHHHTYFTQEDFDSLLQRFPDIYDEPFWDYAGMPVYVLSKMAREHVTVALSGDGGDEIFGGYSSHKAGRQMELLRMLPKSLRSLGTRVPVRKNLNGYTSAYTLREAMKLSLHEPEQFYAKALESDVYSTPATKRWMEEKLRYSLRLADNDLPEGLRIYDLLFHTLGDHFLVKVDRASMACALEVRAPFLDYRLAEYAQRIPREWKVSSSRTKILMREIIKDVVPRSIAERGKQGFTPPLRHWMDLDAYSNTLEEGVALLQQLEPGLHEFYAQKVLKERNGLYDLYRMRLILFMQWWKRWMQ